jgi:sulfite exporter TauE/SafE
MMLETISLLAAAATIGLMGSAHCVGMCGGVSAALLINQDASKPNQFFFAFHFARVLSYVIAGAVLGSIGLVLAQQLAPIGIALKLFAAVMLILVGLYSLNWFNGLRRLEAIGVPVWKKIQPYTKRYLPPKSLKDASLLGALWGWIPCGLVYGALSFALASGSIYRAGLVMFVFGMSTMPSLWLSTMASNRLKHVFSANGSKAVIGMTMLCFGFLNLYSTAGMMISPHHDHHAQSHLEHHHHKGG